MGHPPQLSPEERAQALLKAKISRQLRSAVKEEIRKGDLSIAGFLDRADGDEALSKMRVLELVESIPGIGKVRGKVLLERLDISLTRRVQGLGKRQRQLLLKEFEVPPIAARGRLLVLSGPGGVGKSTVAKRLRELSDFIVIVSHTTRAPRFNEVDGVDYHFATNEVFDSLISSNLLLEWAEFAGNRYGTPRSAVLDALAEGKNVLLEIEIEGAKQVKKVLPEAILIFLEPPTWEELVSRLEGRGTDSPERRAARLALAQDEMAAASFFDKVIVNTSVEEAVARLIELASA